MKLKKNYPHESPIWINNIDINNIVVSKKETFTKQFTIFIGYNNPKQIWPLCIFLPKMHTYRQDFDKTKCMAFLIKEDKF